MEMFSVAVVLLLLARTGSAALAGATVAAVTFPSLFSGPLLGAWRDLTGKRRVIMLLDQAILGTALVAIREGLPLRRDRWTEYGLGDL